MRCHQVMRPKEGGGGGRRKEKERAEVLPTVGSQKRLVARKTRGGMERAFGCIGFREAENSGSEAGFDHVNVHNRGPEAK